ncbi:hypothetical protein [Hymenobacter cellulosilyticus]|uniref:Exostosin GT47 domain-containing protein n=1 Tax=Hymenobacter cellulosilyticus TaxID=2932248 RepID=A0A8T9QA78_9BACT|nr:hypothetical protein [Hymenobacter cellulosilyticus]UOQ74417.1 hypothetical protein MUN79_11365 [Hymenobacter cellulosilyticus]
MIIKGRNFTNVFFNFSQEGWDSDANYENDYFSNLLIGIHEILGKEADDYIFIIYSHLYLDKDDKYDFIEEHGDSKKIVIFYLSDEDPNGPMPDELMSKKVFAVFKAFLAKEPAYPNLYKLPLGYATSTKHQPVTEINTRKINVFFSGALHNTRLGLFKNFTFFRALPEWYWVRIFHRFKKYIPHNYDSFYPNSHIQFNKGGFRSGMTPAKYTDLLYNCKISLCPTGILSVETLRHFESMRAGCIVISEPLPKAYYYDGSPMIILDDWSKLDGVVKDLLANPQKMSELQQKTLDWWENICAEPAVAKHIVETLRNQK